MTTPVATAALPTATAPAAKAESKPAAAATPAAGSGAAKKSRPPRVQAPAVLAGTEPAVPVTAATAAAAAGGSEPAAAAKRRVICAEALSWLRAQKLPLTSHCACVAAPPPPPVTLGSVPKGDPEVAAAALKCVCSRLLAPLPFLRLIFWLFVGSCAAVLEPRPTPKPPLRRRPPPPLHR